MNNWTKTIFRHDTPQGGVWYSVAVLGKDQAGEKQYEYWPVDFPQGTDIPDRSRVEFKDFYISFYTRQDGSVQHKFVVQDFLTPRATQQPVMNRQPQVYQQPQPQGWSNGWPQPAPQYMPPQGYSQPPQVQTNPAPQQKQQADFEQINEEVPF